MTATFKGLQSEDLTPLTACTSLTVFTWLDQRLPFISLSCHCSSFPDVQYVPYIPIHHLPFQPKSACHSFFHQQFLLVVSLAGPSFHCQMTRPFQSLRSSGNFKISPLNLILQNIQSKTVQKILLGEFRSKHCNAISVFFYVCVCVCVCAFVFVCVSNFLLHLLINYELVFCML